MSRSKPGKGKAKKTPWIIATVGVRDDVLEGTRLHAHRSINIRMWPDLKAAHKLIETE